MLKFEIALAKDIDPLGKIDCLKCEDSFGEIVWLPLWDNEKGVWIV